MRFDAEINNRRAWVELEERDGRVRARVDQRVYELEVFNPEEGAYLFFFGNKVFEATVWKTDRDALNVELAGRTFAVRISDRRRRHSSAEHQEVGKRTLTAPMPGKVVRVLLGPGDVVAAGQGVVVVEAMKMQNEIKSPKSGRIVEVRVGEGSTVNANQVLAVVE